MDQLVSFGEWKIRYILDKGQLYSCSVYLLQIITLLTIYFWNKQIQTWWSGEKAMENSDSALLD